MQVVVGPVVRALLAALVLIFASEGGVFAGPREDGMAAFFRRDYKTALDLWKPLAEGGEADIQNRLGLMFKNGLGVPHDDAEQGHSHAQESLGEAYAYGRGVEKDDTEALRWFRLAAIRNQTDAMDWIGFFTRWGGVCRRTLLRQ